MNPITDIVESEENSRAKLFAQYQAMLQNMAANRAPESVQASGKSEHGSENESEEKFAQREDEKEDQWIRDKPDEDNVSNHSDSQIGQLESKSTSSHQPKDLLSEEDEDLIRRLRARDREVRQHEQAHSVALGPYAGAIRYTYQIGPDGQAYAIGGSTEVRSSVNASPETIQTRARAIRAAATAASEPSMADMAAAADARRSEIEAPLRNPEKS